MNDVRRFFWPFLTYLPCPTILPYKVQYLEAFLDPLPTLKLDVIYGRSLSIIANKPNFLKDL